MNAVIYARFSSAGQREESIEGQIRECRAYAIKKGYSVVGEYTDRALTGTNDKRPEFQRMIYDSAKGGFDIVICWKHDRFARNRYDAAMYKAKLKAHNVSIEYAMESIPQGAEGIILDSVMEGYAEYYSANLSENVKRGMYDSALKRQAMGYLVLGYKTALDGTYEIDEEQAPIVRRIFEDYANGKSARDMMTELNSTGHRQRNGHKFTYNSIVKIIRNKKYIGVYEFADIYDENGIPPIVSKELFVRANDMADKHRHAPRSNDDYILSGKLYCGECGEPMTASSGTSKLGKTYKYYACRKSRQHLCNKKNVGKEYIEGIVMQTIVQAIESDEFINEVANYFIEWQDREYTDSTLPSLERRLVDVNKQIGNIVDIIANGKFVSALEPKMNELIEEKEQLEKGIGEALVEAPHLTKEDVIEFFKDFRKGDVDVPEYKRWLLKTFVNRIYVFDDGRLVIQTTNGGECSAIELNVLNDALSFNNCSSFTTSTLPKSVKSNTLFFNGFSLILTQI